MSFASRSVLVYFLLALGASTGMAAQTPAPETADILTLERTLAAAMHARDEDQLQALLAPGYVLRGAPDIDRAAWIRNAVTLCWGDRSDIDDFRATPVGDVVIASFASTFYVNPEGCRPAVLRSLITDVWTRTGSGWQLLTRHSGPMPAGGIAAQFGLVPQAPPIWDVGGELSLVATGGNTSTQTIGLGGTLSHRMGPSATSGSVSFLTSESDSVLGARALTIQSRYGRRLGEHLELFGRGVYARDRFAGFAHRTTIDGGGAYSRTLGPGHELTGEGGLGVTLERRPDAVDLDFATGTGALRYLWRLGGNSELRQEIAFIADLETARNWRSTSDTILELALNATLSLKTSVAVEHRRMPAPGFERTDLRSAAALVVSFQQRPPVP